MASLNAVEVSLSAGTTNRAAPNAIPANLTGRVSLTQYDSLGRAFQTETRSGATVTLSATGETLLTTSGSLETRSETTFGSFGRVAESRSYVASAADPAAMQASSLTSQVTNTYDALGRGVSQLGTPVSVRNASGQFIAVRPETLTEYDSQGRAYRTTSGVAVRADGTRDVSQAVTTTSTFDLQGRVIASTTRGIDQTTGQTQTVTTRTQYNILGQKIADIDALGQTKTFAYDAQGRLVATTLPALADGTTAFRRCLGFSQPVSFCSLPRPSGPTTCRRPTDVSRF